LELSREDEKKRLTEYMGRGGGEDIERRQRRSRRKADGRKKGG
jgi:hypothetical protein